MDYIWKKSKELIQQKLDFRDYTSWVEPIKFDGYDQETLQLKAPNKFVRNWFSKNYIDLAIDAINEVSGRLVKIKVDVDPESSNDPPTFSQKVQMDFGETFFSDSPEKSKSSTKGRENPGQKETIANEKYSFDRFIVGPSNQFAHASAMAVAKNPGQAFNPLFIYGGTGLGKTHLLGAIANYSLSSQKPDKPLQILSMSAEHFMNEMISSIQQKRYNSFRNKFRKADMLLLDDIQFIAGKERTQDEFFHTFNQLYERGSQIVLTSDKFPKDIPDLEDRLRTRFSWGLIADIQPPELETRVAILKRKAKEDNFVLPDDVAFFLASHFTSNIRELEGALIRLEAFTSLGGQKVTLEITKQILRHVLGDLDKKPTIEQIQKVTCDYFKIKLADMKSPKKSKSVAVPRQVAMYLSRNLVSASYPDIGQRFGGRDHSTVMHAVAKIDNLIKQDPEILAAVEILMKRLKG